MRKADGAKAGEIAHSRKRVRRHTLGHDPEKWSPVFGQDHAQDDPMNRVFLDVQKSVCGRVWRDRLDERGNARALAIAQRHEVSELLARVLAGRDVEADSVAEFLDPTVRRLMPDPDTLTDMPKAATRIADAIERHETIAIFGDYDVDGATSAAVLAKFLRHAGSDPLIHIPD